MLPSAVPEKTINRRLLDGGNANFLMVPSTNNEEITTPYTAIL
jgi:hypothetical protein